MLIIFILAYLGRKSSSDCGKDRWVKSQRGKKRRHEVPQEEAFSITFSITAASGQTQTSEGGSIESLVAGQELLRLQKGMGPNEEISQEPPCRRRTVRPI